MDDSGAYRDGRRLRGTAYKAGAILSVVAFLVGCTTNAPATPGASGAASTPAAGTSNPNPVPTGSVVVGVSDLGSMSWAPWLPTGDEEVVFQLTNDSLTNWPLNGEVQTGLAESWSVTPDNKTWTFKLRADIPFHDDYGTVTAEDVKFSWEQAIQPAAENLNETDNLSQAVDGDMNNFKIISPLEFSVTTTKPVVYLPSLVATPTLPIQSKKYWTEHPDEAVNHPIGTGPYRFISSTPGVEVKLQALDHHWLRTAAFKDLTLVLIDDPAAAMAQVRNGAIDLAGITPQLVAEAEAASLKLFDVSDVGSAVLMYGGQYPNDPKRPEAFDANSPWIQADNPEKGKLIREAVSLSIDRKTILDNVLFGKGSLTYAPIRQYPSTPQWLDPSWTLPEYNLERAKQLLAEGGYPNGFPVTVPLFAQDPGMDKVQEAIAGYLEELGLQVTRRPIDNYSVWRPLPIERKTAGNIYMHIYPYYPTDIESFRSFGVESATAQFYDPAITEGFPKLIAESDVAKRAEITRGMLSAVLENYRAMPLFSVNLIYIASPKIGSWTPTLGYNKLSGLATLTP